MIKKINNVLTSIPSTIVGGIFLILSFILPKIGIHFAEHLAWIPTFLCGLPLLFSAVRKLINNKGISKISSALLISIAMIASIAIGDIFAAGEVAFIMALGEILEDLTTDRAKKGLKKLIGLAPTQGRRIFDGKEEIIATEKICVNDYLRILPGEIIPVDGKIVLGETSVDQSVITGEALPVDKGVDDDVFCGTINRFGAIDIIATKVGKDSSLQKLIDMVKEAEDKKAPMARIADKAASWLVPLALLIAIITGIITKDINRAVTVLVVFCPCALVLATPTAIMAAIGQATKHGVIVKSGEALEKMGKVDTIFFDKTGTLTHGKLQVSDIVSFNDNFDSKKIVSLAASAEAKSEHPLGKAIVEYAKENKLNISQTTDFKMYAGKGVFAKVEDYGILCGNERFIEANGVCILENAKVCLEKLRLQGKASILVALNSDLIGVIALSDTIRSQADTIISKLKAINVSPILLTGDHKLTAEYFAKQVGINDVYFELLPEDKVEKICSTQAQNKTVCMIGDGINDAPALKTADVGIAMASMGSDIATNAADIALMSDDISKIPYLKKLSVATVGTIKFSIALSMLINILAVILSVMGILNPTTGALVHNAGSVFVILIAALLYDRKFD